MFADMDQDEILRIYQEGIAKKRQKVVWEIERSYDKDFIFESAKLRGWLENKVQVKHFYEPTASNSVREYWTIEPFEENCQCPNLVPVPDPASNEG